MLTQTAKPQVEAKTVARVKSPLALQIKHAYRRTDVWSADSNQALDKSGYYFGTASEAVVYLGARRESVDMTLDRALVVRAAVQYLRLQDREENPSGTFDDGGRLVSRRWRSAAMLPGHPSAIPVVSILANDALPICRTCRAT